MWSQKEEEEDGGRGRKEDEGAWTASFLGPGCWFRPLPAASCRRRRNGCGRSRGQEERDRRGRIRVGGARELDLPCSAVASRAFFAVGRYPCKPPRPNADGQKSVGQLKQPPQRCHCGPKMPLPPGAPAATLQARDRAASADSSGAGSGCSVLERATCRNRGTAKTFDLLIRSGSGSEEAAQGPCGAAGSPPPCPPEGAGMELEILGGAYQELEVAA